MGNYFAHTWMRQNFVSKDKNLRLKKSFNLQVKVRPVVLFQICDAYERRNIENDRVIGTVLGWFATGNEITSHSALIHDYYARGTKDPIHLTVDATLINAKMNLKAYVFVPIGVPGATSGSMFTPVPVE